MRRKGIVAFLRQLTRTTSIVVALAVLLAVVAGVASLAVAKPTEGGTTPTKTLLLGITNAANAVTTLVNSGTGAALELRVANPQTDPPLKVNSSKTVVGLDADTVDGKDSPALGGDSTAFGVTMKTNHQHPNECENANTDNECAPVEVTVPTGKEYNVTIFSSFVTDRQNLAEPLSIFWCPAVKGGTFTTPTCMYGDPNGPLRNSYDIAQHGGEIAGAGSGEIGPLPAGTYTFSTNLNPSGDLDDLPLNWKAHTTVLVTDASAPGPPIE